MWSAKRDVDLVGDASALARDLLADLPERLEHSAAVAERAEELAGIVGPTDRRLLVAAAWLHDIGYSALVKDSGFHPLDGARYLYRHGWPGRLCALIAYHSGARFVAQASGLDAELGRFGDEGSAVSDALTYADQTRGPYGRPTTVSQRLLDALERHGPSSAQALAYPRRAPHLLDVAARVQARLSAPCLG